MHRLASVVTVLAGAAPAAAQPACALNSAEVISASRELQSGIAAALNLAERGDSGGARGLISQASQTLERLESDLSCRARNANALVDGCRIVVSKLEAHVGGLQERENALARSLADVQRTFIITAEAARLNAAAAEKAEAEVKAAESRLAEIKARADELNRWWWVPGYGQYLAIRTLADNDIGRLQSAVDERNAGRSEAQQLAEARRKLADEVVAATNLRQCLSKRANGAAVLTRQASSVQAAAVQARLRVERARLLASTAGDLGRGPARGGIALADLLLESGGDTRNSPSIQALVKSLDDLVAMLTADPNAVTPVAACADPFDTVSDPQSGGSTLPPEGTLVTDGSGRYLLVDGGMLRPIADEAQLPALGLTGQGALLIDIGRLQQMRQGDKLPVLPQPAGDGAVLRNAAGAHFVMQDGRLRLIPNPETFLGLGLDWAEATLLPDAVLAALPPGPAFPALPALRIPGLPSEFADLLRQTVANSGALPTQPALLVRDPTTGEIYRFRHGRREWVPDPETLGGLGLRADQAPDVDATILSLLPVAGCS